jgi:YidC/Oxa1 family membrane protein insertase
VHNKYFLAGIVPPEGVSSRALATGNGGGDLRTGVELVMPLTGGAGTHDFRVYLGPMDYHRLKAEGLDLEHAVNLGWRIFRPVSRLLLALMVWLYGFIPNYGVVIIIISAAAKFAFYPLTRSSVVSMRRMQLIQPQVDAIRAKYKGDQQRQQREMMALYKENKINPMGGCLPVVVQMPVFIALYAVLANSIELRQAGFFAWITDLSTPDTIARFKGFPIHVLPVVMFLTTIAQQRFTPMNDPRQKMMGYMMPFVMLFIFYSFPAGLNLYWTVNNILTVYQNWRIHREHPAQEKAHVPEPARPSGSRRGLRLFGKDN